MLIREADMAVPTATEITIKAMAFFWFRNDFFIILNNMPDYR
jgi:hypothetical protein